MDNSVKTSGSGFSKMLTTVRADLLKKGLSAADVNSVLDKVAGAASSNSHGWCKPLQPGEAVSNPVREQLLKKGLSAADVNRILDKVSGAASSNTNGWCKPLQPGEEVVNPPMRR